jgi:hypothetical protein
MHHNFFRIVFIFSIFLVSYSASAQEAPDETLQQLKLQLDSLKADYEQRIKNLETQIEQLQIQMLQAPEPEAAAAEQPPVQSFPGILNPAISVIGNFMGRADDDTVFNDEGDAIDDKVNLREV